MLRSHSSCYFLLSICQKFAQARRKQKIKTEFVGLHTCMFCAPVTMIPRKDVSIRKTLYLNYVREKFIIISGD